LLWKDFVRFLFGDDVSFGAGDDCEIAGDGGDVDLAGRVDGDLAGCGRVALWGDANVGGDDFDGIGVVATEGECAAAQFGNGSFRAARRVEAALAVGGEAIAGIGDADVGRAADVGADFLAGKNAGAFGERTLANVSEIRLEHDAKRRVLRG